MITWEDFAKIDLHIGTVVQAELNQKAKKPSYILTLDFGALGLKQSSAQITENYTCDELVGMQVACVMNFPPKRIAGVKSEVLVLAGVCSQAGTVLLTPNLQVENGVAVS